MKAKFILAIFIAANFILVGWVIPTGQTFDSKNAIRGDAGTGWAGTYRGTLPCASCEGMQTELTLNKNKSYDLIIRYLGKKDATRAFTNKFAINKEGTIITLGGLKEEAQPTQYLIGDGNLTQLDMSGKKIEGDLAAKYVLIKGKPSVEEKYWKLIQLHGSEVTPEAGNRREPNLMLKAEGNRVTGSGGCNTFSGNYELNDENGIAFTKVIATQMECISMETEPKFLRILSIVNKYRISGDTLILSEGTNPPSVKLVAVYKK
ncbi:MAG: copper resistance protein NlpE N-terminal domain-containing protein [Bacteroidetes bacterium]|nr:copper resistance protein NlpE N-terminal domain-containing protein [Bacteroidota bacterium]